MNTPEKYRHNKVESQKTQQAIEEFIERMGLISQAEGIPRISGRILGVLVLFDEPFSFAQLSEKLQVSRASISTNTRLLETLTIIERTTKRGERQDYFRLRKNPYVSLMRGVQTRMLYAQEVVEQTRQQLPEEWSGAQKRLQELEKFYTDFYQASLAITNK
jgi:DNA-binding transcriptional regulator GbsR (MarR family)